MKKLLGILVLGLLLSSNSFAGWKKNEKIIACGSKYSNTGDLSTKYFAYNKEYIWYDWSVSKQSFQKSVPVTNYRKNVYIEGKSGMHRVELYHRDKTGFVAYTQNNLINCKEIKNLP